MLSFNKLQNFLSKHNIHADEVGRDKNVIKFEIKDSREVFKMYRLNYKNHTYEGYNLYFEHFSKNNFQCTLNKIKN